MLIFSSKYDEITFPHEFVVLIPYSISLGWYYHENVIKNGGIKPFTYYNATCTVPTKTNEQILTKVCYGRANGRMNGWADIPKFIGPCRKIEVQQNHVWVIWKQCFFVSHLVMRELTFHLNNFLFCVHCFSFPQIFLKKYIYIYIYIVFFQPAQ